MKAGTDPQRAWWEGAGLGRVILDLAAAGLGGMRPGGGRAALGMEDRLDDGAVDSLERMRLSLAVARMLGLDDPGEGAGLAAAATLAAMTDEARRLLPAADGSVTFRTSGSTGAARPARHGLASLEGEVEELAGLLGGARRVVALVPAHHIYGFLFTVLLPHRLGVPVVDARPGGPLGLPAACRPGDLVVAHPLVWAEAAGGGWPAGVTGTTSGAPCPPGLGPRLRAGGLERLVEVYGSTETAGIGWRDADGAPFRLLERWVREGEGLRARDGGAAVPIPDHATWEDDRHLRPTGRRDGAVQVAGTNVHPARVRAVLLAHPRVADAAVRLMRPDEGEWIKAFVVPEGGAGAPDPGGAALRAELDGWLRARLSAPERPRSITFGPALPVTPAGKPSDWIASDL